MHWSILDFFRSFCFIIINEFSRECLVIRVKKAQLNHVINTLTVLFVVRGVPAYIRSDNGPKFIVKLSDYGSRALAQRPPIASLDHALENGYCESFNARFRDELLIGRYSIPWKPRSHRKVRRHYNTNRTHPPSDTNRPQPKASSPWRRGQ